MAAAEHFGAIELTGAHATNYLRSGFEAARQVEISRTIGEQHSNLPKGSQTNPGNVLQLFDVLRLRKGDQHSELTTIWKCYVMGARAGPDLLISMIYGREGAPPP